MANPGAVRPRASDRVDPPPSFVPTDLSAKAVSKADTLTKYVPFHEDERTCYEQFSDWVNDHERTITRVLTIVSIVLGIVALGFLLALTYAPITAVLAVVLTAGFIAANVLIAIVTVIALAYVIFKFSQNMPLIRSRISRYFANRAGD